MAEQLRHADRRRRRYVALTLGAAVLVALLWPLALVRAQAPAAPAATALPTSRIVQLDLHQPAPFAGMLILDDDLVAWRQTIERLQQEIQLGQMRYDALTQVRTEERQAQTTACDGRLTVVQDLWKQRADELRADAVAARHERDEARAREGPRWWQRPGIWFVLGAAVATGAAIAVEKAVH